MDGVKKIALVCRRVEGVTGTATTVFEHARRLTEMGHQVTVMGQFLDEERVRRTGAAPRRLRGWPWGSRAKRRFFSWRAERACAREGFPLVHGHGDVLSQDILSLHNCVHAVHEVLNQGRPFPARSGVGWMHEAQLKGRRFRRLIANSRLMANDVSRRFGVPPEKIDIIHPGHDPQRFNAQGRPLWREKTRRALGVPSDALLVGLITSGDLAKRGVSLFMEALSRLSPELRRSAYALVVGKETRPAPFQSLVPSDMRSRFLFRPPAPDVEGFYHALDVYVHPAVYEEFGQSVQEALACGVQVITSRRVGAAELLTGEAANGLLDAPEPAALAARIERLMKEEPLRHRWASLGPGCAASNTWEENFRKTWACYEKVWAEKPLIRPFGAPSP